MDVIEFEWDERKNESNRKKHRIWFEEAQQVFDDPNGLVFYDEDHSNHEDRFLLLGLSGSARVLVIVFCERNKREIVRIISARKATKKEIKSYEEGI
ncbi:MAG: BrnT family toxin [Nitrospirae bacterium]|nr:BrnT family toxin [Nitrospirota bacterium]